MSEPPGEARLFRLVRIRAQLGGVAGRRGALPHPPGAVAHEIGRAQASVLSIEPFPRFEDEILTGRDKTRMLAVRYHDP